MTQTEKPVADISEADDDTTGKSDAPIQNMYTFWYMKRNTANKAESYEKSIKELGDFKTVQGFWCIYNHLVRPNDLPNTMDYHLFKTGIKPMWEDPSNRRGGKWMVRMRKGIASRYWEDLILAIIGEQFDVGNEICGAVISIRYNEDIISLWNRNADNNEACYRIRDTMRRVLNLPQFVALEYKRHDASLNDNTSFRNTVVWRSEKNSSSGDRSNSGRFNQSSVGKENGATHHFSAAITTSNLNDTVQKSETDTSNVPNAWERDTKKSLFSEVDEEEDTHSQPHDGGHSAAYETS